LNGEVGQECFDFGSPHFFGVAFMVKQNIPPNPIHVTFFSPVGIVFAANGVTDLIQKLFELGFD
jgi:hypothetical protein